MSTPWTKGPWRRGWVERGDGTPIEDQAVVYAGENGQIDIEGDDAQANADLIAAAPLMAEALEAFNLKPDAIVGGTADHLVVRLPLTAISQAAAALKAARGEQP